MSQPLYTSLKLLSASENMKTTKDGVEFMLGHQLFVSRLFMLLTGLSYCASLISMGLILGESFADIHSDLRAVGFFTPIAFAIYLTYYGPSCFNFYMKVVLFLIAGMFLTIVSNNTPILIYSLPLVVVGHIGNYAFQRVMGDNLTIKFLPDSYNIHYRNRVIAEGELSQNDFEIRLICGREDAKWVVVFLPAMKYALNKSSILSLEGVIAYYAINDIRNVRNDTILVTIFADLEKLFDHLDLKYNRYSWIVRTKA